MAEMYAEALSVVRQGAGASAQPGDFQESRHAYMRYVGQGHEISVPLPVETYGQAHGEIFRRRFEAAYRQLYGRIIEGVEIEVLSWALALAAPCAEAAAAPAAAGTTAVADPAPIARQALFDPAGGDAATAPVWLRTDLPPGFTVRGPALITEAQTTTVVPAGWEAGLDVHGCIVLMRVEDTDE